MVFAKKSNSVGEDVNNLLTRKRLPSRKLTQIQKKITKLDAWVIDESKVFHIQLEMRFLRHECRKLVAGVNPQIL